MSEFEENDEFWTDVYFFTSQDPLQRELEKKYHPDTGERIRIVLCYKVNTIKKIVINEAAKGIEENTAKYKSSKPFTNN